MKWIRMSNPGSFDLENRVKFMGASVKIKENSIGCFGNGGLYSFCQACREGLQLKIATNGKVYTLTTQKGEFRDTEFDVVCFKTNTGKIIRTPFVTDLGRSDWTERWFIFRELYSNMLDENGEMDLVDGIVTEPGKTHIFLSYNDFSKEYDNVGDYFKPEPSDTLKEGSGKVYKKSVYVGTIPDLKLDMWSDDIQITESRTMLMDSAIEFLRSSISCCRDEKIWKLFLESKKSTDIRLYIWSDMSETVDKAMKLVYGENYVICPAVDMIMERAIVDGYTPVALCDKWDFSNMKLPTYLSKVRDIGTRALNDTEQILLDKVLKAINFMTKGKPLNISVIENSELARLGDANLDTGEIRIMPDVFKDYKTLLHVIIHEFGHIETKLPDLHRGFTDFFVNQLVELAY